MAMEKITIDRKDIINNGNIFLVLDPFISIVWSK